MDYFTYLNQMLRGSVSIKPVCKVSSPVATVEKALLYKDGDQRRGIDKGSYNEVWVAFDWDGNTEKVREAINLAESHGIKVALSNPSFEVWLLWHFCDYMVTGCDQAQVLAQLEKVFPTYKKGIGSNFNKLPPDGNGQACKRAQLADQKHCREGRSYPDDRPSSKLWELMEHIIDAWHRSRPNESCPLERS